MARLVTLAKAGGKAPFADGGLKLSKSIQTSEIEPHEKFSTLFKIDEDVLQRITGSMKKSGFDASQPVHIWKHTDDAGVTHNYLIDGYTRLSACEKAGITSVPYYEDKFDTEEQAFMHVLHLQVDRRNLAPEELLKFVEELMGSEYVRSTKGRTTEIIADTLGLSPRTVQKAINVIENGDDETKERIASGEITINKADKEIQKRKKKKSAKPAERDGTEDSGDISDSLSEGNAGNPGALNFSHSDGQEHGADERIKGRLDMDNEADVRVAENRRIFLDGRREGYEKGFSDAAYKIWETIVGMLRDGKAADDIESDELFEDFSYVILSEKLGMGYKE